MTDNSFFEKPTEDISKNKTLVRYEFQASPHILTYVTQTVASGFDRFPVNKALQRWY